MQIIQRSQLRRIFRFDSFLPILCLLQVRSVSFSQLSFQLEIKLVQFQTELSFKHLRPAHFQTWRSSSQILLTQPIILYWMERSVSRLMESSCLRVVQTHRRFQLKLTRSQQRMAWSTWSIRLHRTIYLLLLLEQSQMLSSHQQFWFQIDRRLIRFLLCLLIML